MTTFFESGPVQIYGSAVRVKRNAKPKLTSGVRLDKMIVQVISHYYPNWTHKDTGRTWQKAYCPFHGDQNPSASISLEHDAFKCHACGVKGDAIKLIRYKEGCSYREAVTTAARISPGSYDEVSQSTTRVGSRRVFGQARTASEVGYSRNKPVPARIRGRASRRA